MRLAGINHMNNHPELYIESSSAGSWQCYIEQMSEPETWCGNIIIQAISNCDLSQENVH